MNKTDKQNVTVYYLGILLVAALLFIPFLGQVHLFDWDEINFAESAREMITSHDYLTVRINYVPFWEKPPLFIWMQVISMKAFGVNEFAARFPNAVCGILTLLLLFRIGSSLTGPRMGITWVMLYGGSILPFLYFKSGIIDPWFNLFIFLAVYQMILYFRKEKDQITRALLAGVFIGLGILTKGPVALLIFGLTLVIFWIFRKFRMALRAMDVMVFLLALILVGGFWFILQILQGNFHILAEFIQYQIRLFQTHDAGHGGFLFYHFVILFFGVFPASLFALPALLGTRNIDSRDKEFLVWMLILFWVVLILFTIVKTKIVHYSSLCYYPLTFVAAWQLTHQNQLSSKWRKVQQILVIFLGIMLALSVGLLTRIDQFRGYLLSHHLIRDPFAEGCLRAKAGWSGYEWLVSLVLLAGVVLFAIRWKKSGVKAAWLLTGSVSLFMFLSMAEIIPKIERYSQQAAIEFFQSVSDQDAYLVTLGYKSYAQYYYGKIPYRNALQPVSDQWLLTGNIDKPVYIAAKACKLPKYTPLYPDLQLLYEKNGFAFLRRLPKNSP